MIGSWTSWKRFPGIQSGESVEAPVGPGIYEVRYISNGDLAAFDASPNVAYALSSLLRRPPSRKWKRLFGTQNTSWQGNDLEYRTCAAATVGEAKMMAECLLGRRQAFWRRTAAVSRASMSA
jgi:hypothetical protein